MQHAVAVDETHGEATGPAELGFPASLRDAGSFEYEVISFFANLDAGLDFWVVVTGEKPDYGGSVTLPSADHAVQAWLAWYGNGPAATEEVLTLQDGIITLEGTPDRFDKVARLTLVRSDGSLIRVDGGQSRRLQTGTICLGSRAVPLRSDGFRLTLDYLRDAALDGWRCESV
jgi:hypothetical protein